MYLQPALVIAAPPSSEVHSFIS